MDKEIMDGETLIIKYITPGGRGCMKLYLPEYYKRPAISWTRKVLKVIDLSPDADKIRTALWEWLEDRFHEVSTDPEDIAFQKKMANAYADAKQDAADLRPKIENTENIVKRMSEAVKGLPKRAPEREMLKKAREELKALRNKQKSFERKAAEILRYVDQNKRDYEKWLKVISLVTGDE